MREAGSVHHHGRTVFKLQSHTIGSLKASGFSKIDRIDRHGHGLRATVSGAHIGLKRLLCEDRVSDRSAREQLASAWRPWSQGPEICGLGQTGHNHRLESRFHKHHKQLICDTRSRKRLCIEGCDCCKFEMACLSSTSHVLQGSSIDGMALAMEDAEVNESIEDEVRWNFRDFKKVRDDILDTQGLTRHACKTVDSGKAENVSIQHDAEILKLCRVNSEEVGIEDHLTIKTVATTSDSDTCNEFAKEFLPVTPPLLCSIHLESTTVKKPCSTKRKRETLPHSVQSCSRPFVDVTNKFRIQAPAAVKAELEEQDLHRLSQRQKQIDFGKNTLGYERYVELIPRCKRKKTDPQTPNPKQICSKRSWDGQVRKWRRLLHVYDPPVEEGDEMAEDFVSMKGDLVSMTYAPDCVATDERPAGSESDAENMKPTEDKKANDLSIYEEWTEPYFCDWNV